MIPDLDLSLITLPYDEIKSHLTAYVFMGIARGNREAFELFLCEEVLLLSNVRYSLLHKINFNLSLEAYSTMTEVRQFQKIFLCFANTLNTCRTKDLQPTISKFPQIRHIG
jgi:hypothetical protein